MIYLDYAATTPVDDRVIEVMLAYLGKNSTFGNAASTTHAYGIAAAKALTEARAELAASINASPEEIVFTSGATESDNLALKGLMQFYQRSGNHLIVGAAEHSAVIDSAKALEQQGFTVTYLLPDANGLYSLDALKTAVRPDTLLISIMHVNNETGVIQDIQSLAEFAKSRGIYFHTDATQSFGKVSLDVTKLPADLIAFSAHKIYGPKGIGALYVRKQPRVRLIEQISGGRHEQGLRSGTLPIHQIMGFAKATALMHAERATEWSRIANLRQEFLANLKNVQGITLNAPSNHALPQILSLRFEHVDNKALMREVSTIAFSAGSACSSKSLSASHVLQAMGLSTLESRNTVRFSFGRYTTTEEINHATTLLIPAIHSLRAENPLTILELAS